MDERIGKLISILYRKGQIYLGKKLKPFDIGAAEVPVLLSLYQKDGVTQEDLVSHVCLDKSAITRILQSLLRKGYITKTKDQKDLRCNRIYLTKEGLDLRLPLEQALDDWNHILMNALNETDQNTAYTLLECMVNNVKETKNE